MSMDIERPQTSALEAVVAREHWDPIARSAAVQAGVFAIVSLLLGMPAFGTLTLVHVLTLFAAIFTNVMALRLDEEGKGEDAVRVARRSVAALAVSVGSLGVLTLMG